MTLRISQFAVVCGLILLALPGVVQAQAPRYQSPIAVPSAPQAQTIPMPTPITPNGAVVEDVVVRVNDQIITRSDVQRAEAQLAQENQQANASPAEAEERQTNLLRDMIDQQLLLSRGKELGINGDAEVIRRLDEIRKQNHMDSMEDLEKAARSQGVSFEDFKANIRNSVITQQVVRDEVGRRLQMTPNQEQTYYEAHKQEFAQPEQIRLSEIMIPTPADADDGTVAQAQKKAEDVEAKLAGGMTFEAAAKTYSGGQSAAQGGDLGLYKRGALAKVLEDQTFVLKPGQMTQPIRTRQGYVILKVTDHQNAGVPPLKDVEPQVQEAMYMEQLQPALRAYLTKLREDSYIEIKEGFVDSGASSNQTKPVYTAYTAPVSKKEKKAHQKQRFDRHSAYSTVSKTGAAPVATPAVMTTGGAAATGTTTAQAKAVNAAKPKKVKQEKVRFGQAPQHSLPAGPQETGTGTDVGAGSANAAVAQGVSAPAPGLAIAPVSGSSQVASTSDTDPNYDPLAPKAAAQKKTRYSDRAKTQSATKAKAKSVKAQEKAAATPAPATSDEIAARKAQSAPLGLNGDTAKKPKKVKTKGAPKERLQDKGPTPPKPLPPETPSKAPDRGTPLEGTPGAAKQPAAPDTTAPAAPPAPAAATQN